MTTTTPQKTRAERPPKPSAATITIPPAPLVPAPEIRTRLVADCAWPTEATLPDKKRVSRR